MIAIALAVQLAVSAAEPCEAVRRDHEQFKAWVFSTVKQLEPVASRTPSKSDRLRFNAFDEELDAKITELNRRYEKCRKD